MLTTKVRISHKWAWAVMITLRPVAPRARVLPQSPSPTRLSSSFSLDSAARTASVMCDRTAKIFSPEEKHKQQQNVSKWDFRGQGSVQLESQSTGLSQM